MWKLLLIGVVVWILAMGWVGAEEFLWLRTTEEVQGVVLSSKWVRRDGAYYTIRYETPQGFADSFTEHSAAEFWVERDSGESMPVRYQPRDPRDVRIGTWRNLFGDTLTIFVYGGIMLAAAVANLLFWSRGSS